MSQQAADDSQQTQEVLDSQMSVDQDGQGTQQLLITLAQDILSVCIKTQIKLMFHTCFSSGQVGIVVSCFTFHL